MESCERRTVGQAGSLLLPSSCSGQLSVRVTFQLKLWFNKHNIALHLHTDFNLQLTYPATRMVMGDITRRGMGYLGFFRVTEGTCVLQSKRFEEYSPDSSVAN